MTDITVANRYAEAVFQIAKERGTLEAFQEELDVLRQVFKENPGLVDFFENPGVNASAKKSFVQKVFAGVHEDLLHAIYLLIERHRIESLPLIAEQFEKKALDEWNIAKLEVSSATPLDDRQKDDIIQAFGKKLGKAHVELDNNVDPSLIGGMKVKVGNTIYDGSVRGKLNRLSRTIRTHKI